MSVKTEKDEQLALETRKIKALEKIANSLDALTVWFEEIDKDKNSTLSFEEFLLAFIKFDNKLMKEEIKAIFNYFDKEQ